MPRAIGSVATSATTQVPINASVYTEVTDAVARGIKSSSANDAAAGTGARTVRITYYSYVAATGLMAGPFVAVVTLNGTSAVEVAPTIPITFVEKMEVVTAGSGGVAAGTISLFPVAAGTGTAIAIIATGAVRTFLGHHYVPSGGQVVISDLEMLGGFTTASLVELVVKPYAVTAQVEQPVSGPFGTITTLPRSIPFLDKSLRVIGPCRVRMLVTPTADAQTTRASFGYLDEIPRL